MKYEIIKEDFKVNFWGTTVFRIRHKKTKELGGYIEKESNLSQEGECWVHPDGEVSGEAVVRDRGEIRGGVIRGGVIWGGVIWGGVIWGGEIWGGEIRGGVIWGGVIWGGEIRGGVIRGGEIWGGEIWGGEIQKYAVIKTSDDLLFIGPIGSRKAYITFIKDKEGVLHAVTGCFDGTIERFEKAVKKEHGDNEHGKSYALIIDLAKLKFKAKEKK